MHIKGAAKVTCVSDILAAFLTTVRACVSHLRCCVCLLFQMQDNKTFLSMINSVLHTDGFYFATDYDLTHTLQRLANTSPEFQEMSLLERVTHIFIYHI